jgi:hypothetical protein
MTWTPSSPASTRSIAASSQCISTGRSWAAHRCAITGPKSLPAFPTSRPSSSARRSRRHWLGRVALAGHPHRWAAARHAWSHHLRDSRGPHRLGPTLPRGRRRWPRDRPGRAAHGPRHRIGRPVLWTGSPWPLPCENKYGHLMTNNTAMAPLTLASGVVVCRLPPAYCRGVRRLFAACSHSRRLGMWAGLSSLGRLRRARSPRGAGRRLSYLPPARLKRRTLHRGRRTGRHFGRIRCPAHRRRGRSDPTAGRCPAHRFGDGCPIPSYPCLPG